MMKLNNGDIKTAYHFAATELENIQKYEKQIFSSLDKGDAISGEMLLEYIQVLNSYCDALDLMEHFSAEQFYFERALEMLENYGQASPELVNIKTVTLVKYARLLCTLKQYKKSGELLKETLQYILNNIEYYSDSEVNIEFIKKQLQ